ncbi:MAG: dipeptide/oligopeptide/nickel ABC transporter permease/ATP-binding protein [Pseudomonadota bacterium]
MLTRLWQLPSARLGLGLLSAILLLAIIGPLLSPYSPLAGSDAILAHPSANHLLGTDYLGRDVLSRILCGSPVSVFGAVLVAFIALFVGAIPGILSVYFGAAFEWLSLRVADTLTALPFLLFAASMTALLGNGITQAMVTVGILVAPACYRVSRAAALSVARAQYVEAAILSGASVATIVRNHVWSKVLPPIAIVLANTMGHGLVVVASLTFLGIGVQPPQPTWGGVLASDLGYLSYRPYAPLFPTFLILITVWGFNLIADAIRDVAGESGRVLLEQRKSGASGSGQSIRKKVMSTPGHGSAQSTRTRAVAVPPESDVVLSVKGLAIRHSIARNEVVRGVTFDLRKSRVLGVVGESGSGKTLTCRAILGALPKLFELSKGSIELKGRDISAFTRKDWNAAHGRVISAVFQDPASYLNPAIRVGKQVEEILRVKNKLPRRVARAEVLRLFEALQLRNPELVFEQYTHELSGGMLQRVLIASAIALGPEILIADEATTALDVTVQAEILDLLLQLKDKFGLALIVISHDLAVVAKLCDEVLVMKSGEVLEHGTVHEILRHPQHEYTRLLVAEHNSYGLDRFLKVAEVEKLDHAS